MRDTADICFPTRSTLCLCLLCPGGGPIPATVRCALMRSPHHLGRRVAASGEDERGRSLWLESALNSLLDVVLSWLGSQQAFDIPKEFPLKLSLLLTLPFLLAVCLGIGCGKS